jgi:gamma-glutamylputrescine oxidase
MADAIGGTLERFDLFANVKPWVVPFAHTFNTPMVALGVLYYQIKDRL